MEYIEDDQAPPGMMVGVDYQAFYSGQSSVPLRIDPLPTCPVCCAADWAYWDEETESGKCANRHMIGMGPDGKLYCMAESE